jgi:hypothetical protein
VSGSGRFDFVANHTETEAIRTAAALVRDAVAALPAVVVETKTVKCVRCKGTGGVDAFAHVDGGRCMACQGRGSRVVETKTDRHAADLTEIVARGKAHAAAVELLTGVAGWRAESAKADHQRKLETLRAQYKAVR